MNWGSSIDPFSVTLDSLKVSTFSSANSTNVTTFTYAFFFRLAKRS